MIGCFNCGKHIESSFMVELADTRSYQSSPELCFEPDQEVGNDDELLSDRNHGVALGRNNVGLQLAQTHDNTSLPACQSDKDSLVQQPARSLPKMCCKAPDVVEDELGQSCANCGESFTDNMLGGRSITDTFVNSQPLSDPEYDIQSEDMSEGGVSIPMSTPESKFDCCDNPEYFDLGEGKDEDVQCLNCGAKIDSPVQDQTVIVPTGEDALSATVDSVMDANPDNHRSPPCCTDPHVLPDLAAAILICFNCGATPKPPNVLANKKGKEPAEPDQGLPAEDRVFYKFLAFPKEVRKHIYKMIFQSDRPIRPHLCNKKFITKHSSKSAKVIRFHDDNREGHNTVYESLAITRVSKQIRAESLPVFYGANTFDTVADTPTYFLRLQQLGRFDMIRNVNFGVQLWNSPDHSQKVLRMLLQNLADQEAFEKPHLEKQGELAQLERTCRNQIKAFEKRNRANQLMFEELPMTLGKPFMLGDDPVVRKYKILSPYSTDPGPSDFSKISAQPLSRKSKSRSVDTGLGGKMGAALKGIFSRSCSTDRPAPKNPRDSLGSASLDRSRPLYNGKNSTSPSWTTRSDSSRSSSSSIYNSQNLSLPFLGNPDRTKFFTNDVTVLRSHPLHLMGGLEPEFLVLRMLSTAFKGGNYNRKLVLHVPVATLFDEYLGLNYFPSVCEGLGIQLQLVAGRELETSGSVFTLSWHQKFQKKDFTEATTAKGGEEEHKILTKRVQGLYPDIERVPRPSKRTYYRQYCKSDDGLEWFSIDTAGGGLL